MSEEQNGIQKERKPRGWPKGKKRTPRPVAAVEEALAAAALHDVQSEPTYEMAAQQQEGFQQAVDKAVAEALARLLPKGQPAATPQAGSTLEATAMMESLAMAISKLTDQGIGQKPVSPELLRSREEARQRMLQLIEKARAERRTASYVLVGKQFIGDTLTEPNYIRMSDHTYQPTEIEFDGIPNESMRPLNQTAHEIFEAFKGSIAGTTRPVSRDEGFMQLGRFTVKGDPNREFQGGQPSGEEVATQELFKVRNTDASGYELKNVLGTIAPPALMTR